MPGALSIYWANLKSEPSPGTEETVLQFLGRVPPFLFLDEATLGQIAAQAESRSFPPGTRILEQDGPSAGYLYLIKRGGVKKSLLTAQQEEITVEIAGEGELLGVLSNLEGETSRLDVVTLTETLCYAIPQAIIQTLIKNEPAFAGYLLRFSVHHYLDWSLSRLRQGSLAFENHFLLTEPIRERARRPLVTCPETTPIQEAAQLMSTRQIGSVVIVNANGQPCGIVTDRDLRERVVATGRAVSEPVREIMSHPVRAIAETEPTYKAIRLMITHRLHHLVVTQDDRPVGMIASHDLLIRQSYSALALSREIERQFDLPGLSQIHTLAQQSLLVLLHQGIRLGQLTRLMADLNDQLVARTIELIQASLGPPPVSYCWLVLGSEGRREQTFKTDQDNALIYANPAPGQEEACHTYFLRLGQRIVQGLIEIGFPPCPGRFTADNPLLVQSLNGWQNRFRQWVESQDLAEIVEALLFFDLRGIYGEMALAGQLHDFVDQLLPQHPGFLRRLSQLSTRHPPPLGFLGQLTLEHDGEHKDQLDLKRRGIVPLVDLVRFLAIRHRLRETNTMNRLDHLKRLQAIPAGLADELSQSFEFLLNLRLRLEDEKFGSDQTISYYLNPAELSVLDRKLLKETFKVIKEGQAYIG